MTDSTSPSPASPSTTASTPASKPPPAPKPPNPVLRALGLPTIRARLPSRNWLIFLTVTSSIASLIYYDKRQTRLVREKWCTLVSHQAREPLPTKSLPRKLTVYLAAPPGDGLKYVRDHFKEYVKPVLVAAALDWEVVEGRKEGQLEEKVAERTRKLRRRNGEGVIVEDDEDILEQAKKNAGVQDWDGVEGDIVIGRHTLKEYVRGLHKGWLGPVNSPLAPPSPPPPSPEETFDSPPSIPTDTDAPASTSSEAPSTEVLNKEEPSKPSPLPYEPLPISSYPSLSLSPSIPQVIGPTTAIPLPHILGFLNTPTRIYRFLNRRHLADTAGRSTAAAVLASSRPYISSSTSSLATGDVAFPADEAPPWSSTDRAEGERQGKERIWEQENLLVEEEMDWLKSIKRRKEGEGERVWLDQMVLDPRIAERMQVFELERSEEERAERIARGEEKGRVERKGDEEKGV
ncbi:MAG: mitochondrial import inner membrane translocase subunit tim54 [Vezdaea acicularis]|nr:MAG: mitochondrial import inner membrane translocase subunit tim54 [Vezdaea acicularis]